MKAPKIRKPTRLERQAYEAMTNGKHAYGTYHKICFHLHTPASHDYTLLETWSAQEYLDATEEQLLALCIEKHVIMPTVTLDDIRLEGLFNEFSSKKQVMSFLLLAESIMLAGIEIILVADHNTILGVDKLEKAIKWLHEAKRSQAYPTILLGIEISCADRNHVVGMFQNTADNQKSITNWIEEHLIDEVDGVFATSIDALNFVRSLGGIGYLAHLNTSDIFKKGTFSGGFKKHLFDSITLKYVGLSNIEELSRIEESITKSTNK